MRKNIDKIIAVEGLDKTGKSSFVDAFDATFSNFFENSNEYKLKKFSFPNKNTPIGQSIRTELSSVSPNPDIVSTPNFLAEMNHFWMNELFIQHKNNLLNTPNKNSLNGHIETDENTTYLFDRYFISTLAYQAFFNDSKADLQFIKFSLTNNKFLKIPTDIILLDAPNSVIIERTLEDQKVDKNDFNDTIDETVLDARREAFHKAIKFMEGVGIRLHWFEDTSKFDPFDLAKVLMGKIYQ